MAKDLTVKTIEALKPGAVRREVPDGHRRGLYYVLQASGAASWAYRYRFAGKPKKLTIGPYPAIDLKSARQLAGEAAQSLARGDDPAAAKKEARIAARAAAEPDRDLVESVVETFIERYAKKQTRERSWRETERILYREVVGAWRGRCLSTIKRADVHDLLDKIIDRGAPIQANRTLSALSKMCSWAVERGILDASPCAGVRAPAPETARDRVLNDDEIRAAWAAFDGVGYPFGPLARLLLLTGQRLREVAQTKWSEVDLEAKVWTIPRERSKNGVEHAVPLADAALGILAALPRIEAGRGSAGFLFTLNGHSAVTGFWVAKVGFDNAILAARGGEALEHWTLHDLRRTAASGMAGLNIAPHIVEAVLNHRSGTIRGVARVYNKYDYAAEKRAALDAWARRLDAIVSGAEASNVVEFESARG